MLYVIWYIVAQRNKAKQETQSQSSDLGMSIELWLFIFLHDLIKKLINFRLTVHKSEYIFIYDLDFHLNCCYIIY